MQDTTNLVSRLDSASMEIHANISAIKREYFHKFTNEKDLFKFCLKSKEIRLLLQIVFSVFNYCEEILTGGS